ncbi:MAG: cytochrome b/b6 domain-containing protein [Rhodoferax sp.]|nr:cytochrome b/b6 domain-containing protein [Rhodoferax sp.]
MPQNSHLWRIALNTVRVWDLPTRVFHWSLVGCFIGLVVTGQIGGNAMQWHFRLGYTVLTLLGFRLVWGVVGGHWSRFAAFVKGPSTLLQYMQGKGAPEHSVGHNPLGALSVLGLLFFTLLQVTAGLFSDDEIAASGPLAKMVSGDWVNLATTYHTKVGKFILITLVALHLLAIIYYRVRKGENLVGPMVHGDKQLPQAFTPSRDDIPSRVTGFIIFVICALAVVWLVRWAG